MKKAIHLLSLLVFLAACGKNSNLVVREDGNDQEIQAAFEAFNGIPFAHHYHQEIPSYLTNLGMVVPQVDDHKAALGRVLFYDKNLSKDRSISCASCHKQDKAFSDDVAFSVGVEGRLTSRNSMPLANVASFSAHYSQMGVNQNQPMLLWDDHVPDVAQQSRLTFANPLEMDMEMSEVIARVKEMPYYPYIWKEVYGNFAPTETQVLECLQAFVNAIGSHKTTLDAAMQSTAGNLNESGAQTVITTTTTEMYYGPPIINSDTTILPIFSPSEDRGRFIFVNNCSSCHSPIRPFQEVFAACNGLDMDYKDKGLATITGNPSDEGVFKSPSLRNIALTAPYMHDGRFKTLEEVVNFYSDQVKPHPNLHPNMLHNGNRKLNLKASEKEDLIAFLHALTDHSIASKPQFSNPFK